MSDLIKREDVVFLITHQRAALLEAAEGEAAHHADVLRDMAKWWQELSDAVKKLKDHSLPRPEASFALPWSPEETARRFHDAYELFAPAFGWATQANSRKPWDELQPSIRNLMIAVVRNVLIEQTQSPQLQQEKPCSPKSS